MRASQTIVRGNLRIRPLVACVLLPLAIGDLASSSVLAATLQVTNCNDSGSGSLRAAVAIAHSGDSVSMTALTCGTISLATGALSVPVDDLAMQGPGANTLTIAGSQDPSHFSPVLYHTGHGTLRIDGLRITDSHAQYSVYHKPSHCINSTGTVDLNRSIVTTCYGGGVFANGFSSHYSTISNSPQGVYTLDGNVSIVSSTISDNNSYLTCTGLHLGHPGTPNATVLISNSTISGNGSFDGFDDDNSAGCIYEPVTISNSTVAFNWSWSGAGGLAIFTPEATIESSIFAHNDATDLVAGHVSGHNNLIMTTTVALPADTIKADPLLLPLADNGGPSQTQALAPGSPAIDAGNNLAGLVTDQRGAPFVRSAGAAPDIGAFELQSPAGTIDASFTGSWFDPSQSGQGLMLEVLPNNQLLALWFTFNPAGKQAWFGGVGTYTGNTATITAALPSGGRWLPNFDPGKIVSSTWGTLTFTFTDHDHGRVNFNSLLGYGSGGMDLQRLTNIGTHTGNDTPIGSPGAVIADAAGNVYFSSNPNRIYKLDAQGAFSRVAGTGEPGYSGDGAQARDTRFYFPLSYLELAQDPVDYSPLVGGLALDAGNNLYLADAYNNRVRKIDGSGIVSTIFGNGWRANSGDGGLAANAQIYWPQGVAFDKSGNLFVSSAYGPLRKIAPSGIVSTIAEANCGAGYLGPGLCAPEQIAVDSTGNVYATDSYCRVREIRTDGSIVTVAGDDRDPSNGFAFTCGYSGDRGAATKAAMSVPYAVALDAANNLYVADTGNHCIRKISAGIITTIAGKCTHAGFAGDGGAARDALLDHPRGIAVGADGNIYIADTDNNRIRKVAANGVITTIAGDGALLTTNDARSINPAFTGNWFDPTQSGQGLMLEVLSDNRLLAYWFSFDPAGDSQAWFGGIGTYSGNTATIPDVILPSGGRWIPNFDPRAIVLQPWGTLTFTFQNCNSGQVEFTSGLGYGSGSMNLSRLTQPAGVTCP